MTFKATTSVSTLLAMLTHKRPAWSKTERRFIREFIIPLGVNVDPYGNLYKRIGTAPVMYSSHTDTVHHQGGKQLPYIEKGIAYLAKGSTSNCLGADCTAGVWLMREMILAERPGLYVFHRAEEIGGMGSAYIASQGAKGLTAGIACAIAFDRRGYGDVITHQSGARCCSDAFGLSLAVQLGQPYGLSDGGTFTDTANYTDLIGECTNISVGYDHEHSKSEQLNIGHLTALRECLLSLDVSKLAYNRKPGEMDSEDYYYGRDKVAWDPWDTADQTPRNNTLERLCRDYPDEIAQVLEAYGISADEVAEEIFSRTGFVRR